MHDAAAGVPILLVGPPAVDDDEQNARIGPLDRLLAAAAAALGMPYVPTFAATERDPVWRDPVRAGDGFHPDAAGYAHLAALVTDPILDWLAGERGQRAPATGSGVGRPNRMESMPDATPVISVADVQHLAGLARIALQPGEIEHLAGELNQIVESVKKVQEVATPDVPATSHPLPLVNVLRPDVVGDVLTQEQVLSGAPDQADGRFRVPAILGEEQ
jgi:aspartyl-tRNA(Asn)/glutamyl-tRNA(Gln) amidotransferase subunit C